MTCGPTSLGAVLGVGAACGALCGLGAVDDDGCATSGRAAHEAQGIGNRVGLCWLPVSSFARGWKRVPMQLRGHSTSQGKY